MAVNVQLNREPARSSFGDGSHVARHFYSEFWEMAELTKLKRSGAVAEVANRFLKRSNIPLTIQRVEEIAANHGLVKPDEISILYARQIATPRFENVVFQLVGNVLSDMLNNEGHPSRVAIATYTTDDMTCLSVEKSSYFTIVVPNGERAFSVGIGKPQEGVQIDLQHLQPIQAGLKARIERVFENDLPHGFAKGTSGNGISLVAFHKAISRNIVSETGGDSINGLYGDVLKELLENGYIVPEIRVIDSSGRSTMLRKSMAARGYQQNGGALITPEDIINNSVRATLTPRYGYPLALFTLALSDKVIFTQRYGATEKYFPEEAQGLENALRRELGILMPILDLNSAWHNIRESEILYSVLSHIFPSQKISAMTEDERLRRAMSFYVPAKDYRNGVEAASTSKSESLEEAMQNISANLFRATYGDIVRR